MRQPATIICAALLGLATSGCIASTAVSVVTAPVRAAAQVVDWTTTSQSESDRNRGRALREREEALGRLARRLERADRGCADGDAGDCRRAEALRIEMEQLRDGE